MSRSYAIIGAGALGGYYGSRLEQAGCDVHYLMRGDYDFVAGHGLRVESMHGHVALPKPKIYRDASALPKCDVVVVAMKSTSNAALPALLPAAMKDDGVALVLQNGLGVDEQTAAVVGAQRVVGGLCFLCANRIGPGHVRQTRFDHVKLGEFSSRGVSERVSAIAADFERGDVKAQAVEDLGLARWQKLVWNVPYNGLAAALEVDTSVLMAHAETAALVEALMREVAAGAKAAGGYVIDEAFIQTMLGNTRKMEAYEPSMQIDRQQGRPMEVQAIHGEPVRVAERGGCAVPRMRMLYQQLLLIDAQRGA